MIADIVWLKVLESKTLSQWLLIIFKFQSCFFLFLRTLNFYVYFFLDSRVGCGFCYYIALYFHYLKSGPWEIKNNSKKRSKFLINKILWSPRPKQPRIKCGLKQTNKLLNINQHLPLVLDISHWFWSQFQNLF